ncbi:MAG: ABC transporter substrate-binding protein [Magnetococcales bacterium]|nr:ABC transporter substrate-binding protein [Magnetococcales bacterium]
MKKQTIAFALLLIFQSSALFAAHGLSLDGPLNYPADFKNFSYTEPDKAKIGGTLTLHSLGGFDKMNPFTLKGMAPDLLGTLVFETLTESALDQASVQYGLVAEDIDVADDALSVTYTLRKNARFSDGTPITAEDVRFSLEILKSSAAHPLYQNYYRDIIRAEVLDNQRIRFHFSQKNRELAYITGELPVLSQAYYDKHPFEKGGLETPVGSGPYIIESFKPGKTITYHRNPDYWGWDVPARRGQFNFERIVITFFKDPVVALEAFKAGEFDFIHVMNSKQWARDYLGKPFDEKRIIKETLAHENGQGIQGFVFNLRRDRFKDLRVRKALSLAFDFEWSNKNLFYDQYDRNESYFSNSELAANGMPSKEELALLKPFEAQLNPDVFKAIQPPYSTKPPNSIRKNLRKAKKLLTEAGWHIDSERRMLVNSEGKHFEIEMVLISPAFERILAPYAANLKRLGITLNYRTVDASLYQRRVHDFDYDMIVSVFPQSHSPGNEQRNMWHSSTANTNGSRNYMGLSNPVVDAMVDHIIYAKSRSELITACHALDRILQTNHYLIPNWYIPYHRIAYANKFNRPATAPKFFQPLSWVYSWWIK